eukprot:CAMPEP_0116555484 /NCGR_PEP_ID=MMETSP0397-20121206/8173_1 /TAXON_ID=216820 /ORGANISM="Cyclophora tenuis, Strain ECT3854" /LENGTH=244 /DNA_ID=CAMNT_0004080761 /DNA_START=41 /DNA_END=775 /DNA_ORIENTATION=+
MKLATVLIAATVGSAAAFTAPSVVSQRVATSTARFMSDEEEEAPAVEEVAPAAAAAPSYTCISKDEILASPNTIEFGSVWDPLGLAEWGSDETLAWFRHSEVKHGRIAMAAFVGWCVVGAGIRLPGELAYGLKFADISGKGLDAWDAVPGWGKAQLLLLAGLIEFHDEIFFKLKDTHYLRGGTPGKNMVPGLYDPLGLHKNKSEEAKARGRDVEIKNGRLAMIGIAGFYFASTIPGSVPALIDV